MLIAYALLASVAWQVAGAPIKTSPLFSALSTAEYFGESYTSRARDSVAPFVFFAGEPIKVKIIIGNRGPGDHELRFSAPDEMFSVEATRDGEAATLSVSFSAGRWRGADGTSPFDPTQATLLRPRERVEWRAEVDRPLAPGRYRLRIAPKGAYDGAGAPVLPDVSTHVFDVLPRSADAEPEIARRDALRYYMAGDFANGEAAVGRLLELHPASYEAHLMRGQIADARGDHARATASYTKAAETLDGDLLLRQFKSEAERQRLRRALDARLLSDR